jgi:hypothetical protein
VDPLMRMLTPNLSARDNPNLVIGTKRKVEMRELQHSVNEAYFDLQASIHAFQELREDF